MDDGVQMSKEGTPLSLTPQQGPKVVTDVGPFSVRKKYLEFPVYRNIVAGVLEEVVKGGSTIIQYVIPNKIAYMGDEMSGMGSEIVMAEMDGLDRPSNTGSHIDNSGVSLIGPLVDKEVAVQSIEAKRGVDSFMKGKAVITDPSPMKVSVRKRKRLARSPSQRRSHVSSDSRKKVLDGHGKHHGRSKSSFPSVSSSDIKGGKRKIVNYTNGFDSHKTSRDLGEHDGSSCFSSSGVSGSGGLWSAGLSVGAPAVAPAGVSLAGPFILGRFFASGLVYANLGSNFS
ncbi:hypothetical protein ACOSQ2_012489 [Xanthoceras sorbifolium]